MRTSLYRIEYNEKMVRESGFSLNRIEKILYILRYYRIIRVTPGYSHVNITQVMLRKPIEWNWNILKDFCQDMNSKYSLIAEFTVNEKPAKLKETIKRIAGYVTCSDKSRNRLGDPLPYNNRKHKFDCANDNFYLYPVKDSDILKDTYTINDAIEDERLKYSRRFGDDITQGGRYYSPINGTEKVLRSYLCDKYGYTELDYKNFNPNLLFLLDTGNKYQGDIYTDIMQEFGVVIMDDLKKFRKLFKRIILSLLGVDNRWEAIRSINNILRGKKTIKDKETGKKIEVDKNDEVSILARSFNKEYYSDDTANEILEAIEKVCSPIKEYLYTNLTGICQNIESCIITRIGLECVKDNITPMLIHDAFIVPDRYVEKYLILMEEILIEELNKQKDRINEAVRKNRKTKINKLQDPVLSYIRIPSSKTSSLIPLSSIFKTISTSFNIDKYFSFDRILSIRNGEDFQHFHRDYQYADRGG